MRKHISILLTLALFLCTAIPAAASAEAEPPAADGIETIVSEAEASEEAAEPDEVSFPAEDEKDEPEDEPAVPGEPVPTPAEDGAYMLPASGTWGDNLTWTVDEDRTVTISGTGYMAGINPKYDGYAPWVEYDPVRAVIEPGILNIGANTFCECRYIESVSIPDTVTFIEWGAFYNCKRLTEVEIPRSVTSIGSQAFALCGLRSITLSESIETVGKNAFMHCTALQEIELRCTVISEYMFSYCTSLTEIVIPEWTTVIPLGAFDHCEALTKVTLPSTLVSLSGFDDCRSLREITIPESVKTVAVCAFEHTALETVTLPDGVEKIGASAFARCESLRSVHFSKSLEIIDQQAFSDCPSLAPIDLPDGLTQIGRLAFGACTALTEVTIPDSVEEIRPYAFYQCTGLRSVTLGAGVETIGSRAFDGCTGIRSVTIPASVKTIEDRAFIGCTALSDVRFEGEPDFIGHDALTETPWWAAQDWGDYAVMFGILLEYYGSDTDVTIPETVRRIGELAFDDRDFIESVTVPGFISVIGESAFQRCDGLKKVVLEEGVTEIGDYAFVQCAALSEIYLPKSLKTVGYDAFMYCIALKDVYYAGSASAWKSVEVKNLFTDPEYYILNTAALRFGEADPEPTPTPQAESIAIDGAHFPDARFRSIVSEFDTDGDNALSLAEREAVLYLYCYNKSLTTLKGIEYFPELRELSCTNNPYLKTLDVSSNTKLLCLWCFGTAIQTLDLRAVPALSCLVRQEEMYIENGYARYRGTYGGEETELDTDPGVVILVNEDIPLPEPTPVPTPTPQLPTAAAVQILRYAVGLADSGELPNGADVDLDGDVTPADAARILAR